MDVNGDTKRAGGLKMMKIIRWILTIILVGFVVFVLTDQYIGYRELFHTEGEMEGGKVGFITPRHRIDPEVAARKFLERHKKEIQACEEKDLEVISSVVSDLNRYFDLKKEKVEPLVDELFTLKSKVRMLYYYVRGGGRLERYLQEKIEYYLGGPEDLKEKIEAIASYMKREFMKNHNELMLALETDLALLPYALKISNQSSTHFVNDFRLSFDDTVKSMLPRTVGTQLAVEAICLAVDLWVAPIIGAAIVNFLISNGIITGGALAAEGTVITVGAASGWYTFGASLVAGIIIALVIDWACNEVAEADAIEKINAALETWREGTISSFKESVIKGLEGFHDVRQKALKKALFQEIDILIKKNS